MKLRDPMGEAGSLSTRDSGPGATPGLGGSGGSADAQLGDAGRVGSHKSGCSCELGGSVPSESRWTVPFLLAGVASLFCRRHGRRERKKAPATG